MHSTPSNPQVAADPPETWVARYGDYLYGYALARVRNPSAAEDLVQETLLAALKAFANFRGRSALKTWLTGILKHKIIDHLRRKYREEPLQDVDAGLAQAQEMFDKKGAWLLKPGRWRADPQHLFEQKEFMETLFACLADIPERGAKAFIMREIDGLDTREICKLLDISATNSWVILHRARLLLRRCLEVNWFSANGKRPQP